MFTLGNKMNESEKIRFAIKEWQDTKLEGIKRRIFNIDLFTKIDHIVDIVGVRRAGKTYLIYLVIKELEKKYSKDRIIYVNFENKILYPLNVKLLDELLNYLFEKGVGRAFLFLDEIQNINGWEKWARSIYDSYKGKIKIVVSGSSSKIIRKDIATLLTGRHISIKVFPLSFSEFLEFKEITFGKDDIYSVQKQAVIKSLLKEYIEFGAFPEIILSDSPYIKTELLRAYYDDILYKDIVDKYGIKEKTVLENFVKFLFMNISGYFSYKRGKEYLDSLGIPTSTRTLLKYTSILEDVFLFFFVPIFSRKIRDQAKYPKKMYAVDVGLRNVVHPNTEDFGKKAENVVYLKLRRQNAEINYWKSKQHEEVDFVVREGLKVRQLIQVCWDISSRETKEREIKALIKAAEEFKLKKGLIITGDYEGIETCSGVKIECIPLWKWLLKWKSV
jgi:hypothetical protein